MMMSRMSQLWRLRLPWSSFNLNVRESFRYAFVKDEGVHWTRVDIAIAKKEKNRCSTLEDFISLKHMKQPREYSRECCADGVEHEALGGVRELER